MPLHAFTFSGFQSRRAVRLLLGWVGTVVTAWAGLLPYPTLPTAVPSTTYQVTVNGEAVYVEKFGNVSLARFSFIGTVNVVVTVGSTITSSSISPKFYNVAKTASGTSLSFALSQPRTLIVQINSLENLLLFADGPEVDPPAPGDVGVVDFGTYLSPTRDPNTEVTSSLQTAINDTSALDSGTGGTLYVPDGLYYSAQFKIKSNVRLHLSSGAVIRAVNSFSNTSKYPRQNGSDSSFVYFDTAINAQITGRGVLDGNGWNIRHATDTISGDGTSDGGNCKLIRSRSSTNLLIADVSLRDSARFTVHFLYSDHLTVRGIKIVNDLRPDDGGTRAYVSNTDGIDPDSCTDVLVDGCFIYTEDDALSPKVTGYMNLKKTCSGIAFVNNVVRTNKCALKVGSELMRDVSDVRFSNNDVILADRFLALWGDYGGGSTGYTISNVTAFNNRTDTIGVVDNRCFFHLQIFSYTLDEDPTPAPANITGVLVNGLYAAAAAPRDSKLIGYDATHYIANVTFKNFYQAGAPVSGFSTMPLTFPSNNTPYYNTIGYLAPGDSKIDVRSGVPTLSTTLVPTTPELPVVTANASDDWGRERSDTLTFTLSRVGSLAAPLTVNYTLGGTAAGGVDYTALPGTITFPVGVQQVSVVVTPLIDELNEGDETVTLTLAEASAYAIGSPEAATAIIADALPLALTLPSFPSATVAVVTFQRPIASYGETYAVETSSDLVTWSTDGVTLQLQSTTGDVQTWQAAHAFNDRLFFRLKVTTP